MFESDASSSRAICNAYGMDLISLDTEIEYHYFMEVICKEHNDKLSYVHIGAMTTQGKSLDKWFWMNSGNRIPYSLAFHPEEPNFANDNEYCLMLRANSLECIFNDVPCNQYDLKIVCQKIVNSTSF